MKKLRLPRKIKKKLAYVGFISPVYYQCVLSKKIDEYEKNKNTEKGQEGVEENCNN